MVSVVINMKTMQFMQTNKAENAVLKSYKVIKNFSAYFIEDLIQIYSKDKFNVCMFFGVSISL